MLTRSRKLGEAVNSGQYPTRRDRSSGRPTSTRCNPFWQAPIAYGAALFALRPSAWGSWRGEATLVGRLGRGFTSLA